MWSNIATMQPHNKNNDIDFAAVLLQERTYNISGTILAIDPRSIIELNFARNLVRQSSSTFGLPCLVVSHIEDMPQI